MRDFRGDRNSLERVLVPVAGGQKHVPLGHLATVRAVSGPAMIRNENGLLTGYVYVDLAGRDPAGYVDEAAQLLRERVKLPAGYALSGSGQWEAMQRVRERLTAIVVLAVAFSAIGAVWFLWLLGYNMSVGVWVGLIALLGVDAETGVFMLLYLDLSYEQARKEGRLTSLSDLRAAIVRGAAKWIRPKFMTVATTFLGLIPIMWATGTGSDVMKRIAAPMIGGIFTSFLELVVYPAIYEIWRWNFKLRRKAEAAAGGLGEALA